LFLGAVLARGRRTVTTWIRAAGLSDLAGIGPKHRPELRTKLVLAVELRGKARAGRWRRFESPL
jgi:hypothetical protein